MTTNWPARFPLGKTVIAGLLVSVLTPILLLCVPMLISVFSDLLAGRTPPPEAPGVPWTFTGFAAELLGSVGLGIAFSWPGLLAYTLAGAPTLYLLYRRQVSSWLVFVLLGAMLTAGAWLLFVLYAYAMGGGFVPHPGREIRPPEPALAELLAPIGAINGAIVRWILLRSRAGTRDITMRSPAAVE